MKDVQCIICRLLLSDDDQCKNFNTCATCRETKQFINSENIVRLLNEAAKQNTQQSSVFDLILKELQEIKELLKPIKTNIDTKIKLND